MLETDARSEVGEVSGDAALDLTVLLILFVLVLVAVNLVLARALASFTPLNLAFERIGQGDYTVRLTEAGPPEFARLARSCNAMARELERMDGQTRRLARQLSTVQEEERADLARNLHDEVSPFLFAVEVDARAIRDLAPTAAAPEIAARADAIGEAAAHLKREVKGLLGRLRPETAPDLGLAETIEDLAARLRRRHPGVAILLSAALSREPDPATAQILQQIAREAIGNALQHGHPTRIEIVLNTTSDGLRLLVADDGGGPPASGRSLAKPPGFGILGMRERVAARGGRFAWRERKAPRGVVVEAVLPATLPVEPATALRGVPA